MSRRMRLLSAVACAMIAGAAPGQVLKWSTIGQALNTRTGDQSQMTAALTGNGKVAIVWFDGQSGSLYGTYVDTLGAAPAAGFSISTSNKGQVGVAGDGVDGCIVAWPLKFGTDGANHQVDGMYCQHCSATGSLTWNNAQALKMMPNVADGRSNVMAFPGPNQSAFVTYLNTNYNTGGPGLDLYIQRVDATGRMLWQEGGIPFASGTGSQQLMTGVRNNDNWLILIWNDSRGGTLSPISFFAQSIDSGGVTAWDNNGILVSGSATVAGTAAAIPDGAGGVIFAYTVQQSVSDYNIVAQRLNSFGTKLWGANGIVICDTTGMQQYPAIASDGGSGAVIAWEDHRGSSTDIYAQHVTASGAKTWKAQGAPICTAAGEQLDIRMAANDKGGVVIGWTDQRATPWQIYMQSVATNGVLLWPANGFPAGMGSGSQQHSVMITEAQKGYAFLAWEDARTASNGVDLYGQRVGIQPAIATGRNRIDFGTRTTHDPWFDTLHIRSTGTDSMLVTAWTFTGPSPAGDSVFVVTSPHPPFKLAPGEELVATLRYTPYRNLPNIDTLIIHCTALGPDSVRRVSLIGNGKYPHCKASSDTVDFGGVRLGTTKQQVVTMRNVGNDTAHISAHGVIGSTGDQYSDSLTTYAPIPPFGGSIPIVLACTPTGLGGKNATLQLITDDSTSPYNIQLLANGIFPKTTLTRNGLTFGKVRLNTAKQLVVGVVNVGTDTLHVDSVQLNEDAVHFAVQPSAGAFPLAVKPDDTLSIMVSFTPDTLRTFRAAMQVFTDDTSGSYQVNLVGQGSFATLELQPSLEFGAVYKPRTVDSTIVVRYAGADTVTMQSYAITGPDVRRFSVSGITFPFTVTAGETKLVHIRYTPDSAKRDAATLTFVARYAGNTFDTLTVTLTGGPTATAGVFDGGTLPLGLSVGAGYPNPIVDAGGGAVRSTIVVNTDHAIANADVSVLNLEGRRVQTIYRGALHPGSNVFRIAASALAAGEHICAVVTPEGAVSRRFVVVR